jgi:hypothetical protein
MRFFNPLGCRARGRYRDFCQSDFFLPQLVTDLTPDDSRLTTPKTTPHSIPTNSATASINARSCSIPPEILNRFGVRRQPPCRAEVRGFSRRWMKVQLQVTADENKLAYPAALDLECRVIHRLNRETFRRRPCSHRLDAPFEG